MKDAIQELFAEYLYVVVKAAPLMVGIAFNNKPIIAFGAVLAARAILRVLKAGFN